MKYFTILLTFFLLSIFLTSYFSTPSISTGFTSSTFCFPTCFLYYTTWLTFTTEWILIEVGNHNLLVLVETTFWIIYRPMYQFTRFLASCSLNTRSPLYLALSCHLSFILQLLSFSYLPVVLSPPVLFLLLPQPFLVSSSFFLQTLLLFLLFLSFWYLLLFLTLYYDLP